MSVCVPFLFVAVAVNCWVAPTLMEGAVGVTAIETTVVFFLLLPHPARTNMQRATTAKAPESHRVKFDMITPPNKVRTRKIFVHTPGGRQRAEGSGMHWHSCSNQPAEPRRPAF